MDFWEIVSENATQMFWICRVYAGVSLWRGWWSGWSFAAPWWYFFPILFLCVGWERGCGSKL